MFSTSLYFKFITVRSVFSAATSVFSVTRSFKNHSNMQIKSESSLIIINSRGSHDTFFSGFFWETLVLIIELMGQGLTSLMNCLQYSVNCRCLTRENLLHKQNPVGNILSFEQSIVLRQKGDSSSQRSLWFTA